MGALAFGYHDLDNGWRFWVSLGTHCGSQANGLEPVKICVSIKRLGCDLFRDYNLDQGHVRWERWVGTYQLDTDNSTSLPTCSLLTAFHVWFFVVATETRNTEAPAVPSLACLSITLVWSAAADMPLAVSRLSPLSGASCAP